MQRIDRDSRVAIYHTTSTALLSVDSLVTGCTGGINVAGTSNLDATESSIQSFSCNHILHAYSSTNTPAPPQRFKLSPPSKPPPVFQQPLQPYLHSATTKLNRTNQTTHFNINNTFIVFISSHRCIPSIHPSLPGTSRPTTPTTITPPNPLQ